MREEVVLSKRLLAVASMVSRGNRVCDVGCDHGFVPIYLIQQNISPGVLAMDVKEGPLAQAKEHIKFYGLTDYIETRLSNGLQAYRMGEADTLICAGMGGKLMMQILEAEKAKTDSFQELILQPQSELSQFRAFLRKQGYQIAEENMIEEDGKFYPMMRAVKGNGADLNDALCTEKPLDSGNCTKTVPLRDGLNGAFTAEEIITFSDRYGALLLQTKHPVLYRYLEREQNICEEIMEQLGRQGLDKKERQKRYDEVAGKRSDCMKILQWMQKQDEKNGR